MVHLDSFCFQWRKFEMYVTKVFLEVGLTNSKEPLEESFQLINHSLLLLGSGPAFSKPRHRRHHWFAIQSKHRSNPHS